MKTLMIILTTISFIIAANGTFACIMLLFVLPDEYVEMINSVIEVSHIIKTTGISWILFLVFIYFSHNSEVKY